VAVKGWSLHGEGQCGGRGVDFRGGAQNPEVSQAALVRKEKTERGEAGLNGQDVGGGAHKAVRCPSLDLVPEDRELSGHVDGRHEDIRAIAEDREEERGGQPVAQEGGEADTRRGEALDRHEGCLCLG